MAPRRLLCCGLLGAFAFLLVGCTAYYSPTPAAQHPCSSYGNVSPYDGSSSCITSGDTWTMHLHPSGGCPSNCGMNYQYHWPDQTHRPWAKGGALFVQFNYSVTASFQSGDFHGYFCAQLVDGVTGQSILYCLEPWRPFGAGYAPEIVNWDSTISSQYSTWGGFDAWTHFGPDATLATTPKSSTRSGTPPLGGTFQAFINANQMAGVLAQVNREIAQGQATNPGIRAYSTDPARYSVESFQCGGEGYGMFDVTEACGNISVGTTI